MKLHKFIDAKGRPISYAVLCAVLNESAECIRQKLRREKKIPSAVHEWVKKILDPDTQKIHVLQQQLELEELLGEVEAEVKLLETMKELRDLRFKNYQAEEKYRRERAEGKYSRTLVFTQYQPSISAAANEAIAGEKAHLHLRLRKGD